MLHWSIQSDRENGFLCNEGLFSEARIRAAKLSLQLQRLRRVAQHWEQGLRCTIIKSLPRDQNCESTASGSYVIAKNGQKAVLKRISNRYSIKDIAGIGTIIVGVMIEKGKVC